MRVGAPGLQTYVNGSVQSQDQLRQEQIQKAAREQEKTRQRDQSVTLDQDVQNNDAARRTAQQREVVPTEKSAKSQRSHQYYPFPNNNGLPSSQQRALQTYSNNQDLGRSDSNGEFLGSIDVFA